ncbi:MAG: outer membrane beta-barrel protein [Tidjanibacter sp.]|nr:outer membrane beta-barrel protein [Tidjanibacter sp.]
MKRIFLIVILLFGSVTGVFAAEHILQGRIVDSVSGNGVGYATVVLTDARGKGVSAVAADKEGAFSLFYNKEGVFKLVISSVGYATIEKNIEFGNENESTNLGDISLQAGVEIEGITVKPLVIEKDDRLVYNVKADPEAKYSKMATILAKVPGLKTGFRGIFHHDEGKIEKILIDGKPTSLISEKRQYTMEFIGAAVMDEIEVIMPHSAEYGNEEIIINIKTNQPLPIGAASEIVGDATPKEGNYKANVDVGAKVGKRLSFGANYAYSLTHSPTLHKNSLSEYLGAEGGAPLYIQHNNAADSTRGQTHKLRLDYTNGFNNNGYYSIAISGNFADQNRYGSSEAWRADGTTGNKTNYQSSTSNSNQSSPLNIGGSLYLTLPIVPKKSTLTFTSAYTHDESTTDSWVNTDYADDSAFATHSNSFTQQDQFDATLRGSFTPNEKKGFPIYSLGLSYSGRSYDNNSTRETSDNNNDFVPISGEGLIYNQNIVSADISALFRQKGRSFGLRFYLKHDSTKGIYRDTNNTPLDYSMWTWQAQSHFNVNKFLVPLSVALKAMPKQPSFSLLNPYVNDSNPMHLRYGNPNLRPEMNYGITISSRMPRGVKWIPRWLSIGMTTYQFTYIDNSINPITEMREDGVTVSTYDNFGNEQRHEVRGSLNLHPFKRASIGLYGTFTSATYNISEGYSNTINTFDWSASASYNLRKNKWFDNTSISASYSARPTAAVAQAVDYGYYHSLGISFRTDIPKIKAGLSVRVGDILHGHKFVESTIRSGTFIRHSSNEVLGRSINISAYIRFGKFRRAQGEVDAPESSLKSF